MEHAANNHLNDSNTRFPSAIFDTLLKAHHPQKDPHPPRPSSSHTPNIPTETLHPHEKQGRLKEAVAPMNNSFTHQKVNSDYTSVL
jgi:hypothetical protein